MTIKFVMNTIHLGAKNSFVVNSSLICDKTLIRLNIHLVTHALGTNA